MSTTYIDANLLKAKVIASGTRSLDVQAILSARLKDVTDVTDSLSTSALPLRAWQNPTSVTEQTSAIDPTQWNPGGITTINWSSIVGNPRSNTQLAALLDDKIEVGSLSLNGHILSGSLTLTKSDIGLGLVQNVDQTNASNLQSGIVSISLIPSGVTKQGNTFNGANQLVQLTSGGLLPSLDATNLYNIPGALAQWGYITGTLSGQTDLQNALNSKVDKTTTINGIPLTGDITITVSGGTGGGNWGSISGNINDQTDLVDLINYSSHSYDIALSGQLLTLWHNADKALSGDIYTSYHTADKALSGSLLTLWHNSDMSLSSNIHSQMMSLSASNLATWHQADMTISGALHNEIVSTSASNLNAWHIADLYLSGNAHSQLTSVSAANAIAWHNADKALSASIYSSYHNDDLSLSSNLHSSIVSTSASNLNEWHQADMNVSGSIYNTLHSQITSTSASNLNTWHNADLSLSGNLYSSIVSVSSSLADSYHNDDVALSAGLKPIWHSDDISLSAYLHNQITSTSANNLASWHSDDLSLSSNLHSSIMSTSASNLNTWHTADLNISGNLHSEITSTSAANAAAWHNEDKMLSGSLYSMYHADDLNTSGSLHSEITSTSAANAMAWHNEDKALSGSLYSMYHADDLNISGDLHSQILSTSASNLNTWHNSDLSLSASLYSMYHADDISTSGYLDTLIQARALKTTEVNGYQLTGDVNLTTNDVPTYTNKRYVTDAQLQALSGTYGTPTSANKFVTDTDPRNSDRRTPLYCGTTTVPTITDNGGGNVTIGACVANLNVTTDGSGQIAVCSLSALTVTLTDAMQNFIVADYNGGTPILRNTTTRSDINWFSVVPVYTIYRNGTSLRYISWDAAGTELSEKLLNRTVNNRRFEYDASVGGLTLSEAATQYVVISAGAVWNGVHLQTLSSFNSSANTLEFYYHSGGVWTSSTITQYPNTQYDNGTALQTLTNNRYAVIWVFRGVETTSRAYCVLGTGDYSLASAQASSMPSVPSIISSQAILVGRIIIKKSDTTAYQIDSAFAVSLTSSAVSNHNDLAGIQDATPATAGEHYHLSAGQAANSVKAAGSFNGWVDNSVITISHNETNRTITVTPSTATFDIVCGGIRYTKTGAQTCTAWNNTSGSKFIYFSAADGSLVTSETPWDLHAGIAPVAYVYWDATLNTGNGGFVRKIYELHPNTWPTDVWAEQHSVYGTRWPTNDGFILYSNAQTTGSPSATGLNTCIGLSTGRLRDESLLHTVTNTTTSSQFMGQDLGPTSAVSITTSNGAKLDIMYYDGTKWTFRAATRFPFLYNAATNVPQYVNASGTITDVTNGYYFGYIVIATGDWQYGKPVYAIPFYQSFSSLAAAQAGITFNNITANIAAFSLTESLICYRLIFRYRSIFDAAVKYTQLQDVADYRSYGFVQLNSASSLPSAHALTHTNGTDQVANFVGDAGSGGSAGFVPAPAAGDAAAGKVLGAAGSWIVPSGTGGGITALSGDVTASGTGSVVATIANNAVTNAKLAQMATKTVKANITTSTATPTDVSISTFMIYGGVYFTSDSLYIDSSASAHYLNGSYGSGTGNTICAIQGMTPNNYCNYNTALGTWAGYSSGSDATSSHPLNGNVMIGYQSGLSLSADSNYNVMIGYKTRVINGSKNVIIGYPGDAADKNGTYFITSGGSSIVLIGGNATNTNVSNSVDINGIFLYNGTNATINSSVTLTASTTSNASLTIPAGTAPTSPSQGQMYAVTGHLYFNDSSENHDLLNPSVIQITSTGHGFTSSNVNQPISKLANGTYTLSKADTAANSEFVGIFTQYIDANTFTLTIPTSRYKWTSHGFTGPVVWLSDTTAGTLTDTAPTTAGHYLKPIARVIDTNTLEIIDQTACEIVTNVTSYSVLSGCRGLVITVTSSTQITITATEVLLKNALYNSQLITSPSLTITTSVSGANGLDTGSIASSSWYAVYIISNGTTTSGLLSRSSTSPSLPSGYTYYLRVGWVKTNASSNLLQTKQNGNILDYRLLSASSLYPVMSSGTAGSINNGVVTWSELAISSFVPTTASRIRVRLSQNQSTYGATLLVAVTNYGTYPYSTNYADEGYAYNNHASLDSGGYGGGNLKQICATLTLESSNIYIVTTASSSKVICLGWEDNI